jgi:N-acetylmuramoyl-L-alanine amidase
MRVILWLRYYSALLVLGGLLAVWFTPQAHATQLRGLSFEVGQSVERITILTSGKLDRKSMFLLHKPDRLVIDFARFSAHQASLPETYRGKLIKSVRSGAHRKSMTRLVFDLTKPIDIIASYNVQPAGSLWRYVIDIRKAVNAKNSTINTASSKGGKQKPTAQNTVKNTRPKPLAASVNVSSKRIAEKAKRKVIVIDPGHGGKDPGALGRLHKEKDLTLRFAKALKKALAKTGKFQVYLTRDKDRFIALKSRVDIARKHKAHLFISLHADSNPNKKAKGLSIYTLSETASDAESAALAARENKSDIIDGIDLGEADEDVADILIDLLQRETMSKSNALAEMLINALKRRVALLHRSHRFAGFRVLKAPDTPSVLIELGFLSSRDDERRLASPAYRAQVASALTKGITRYLAAQ